MRENAYDAASTASTVATKNTIVAFRNFAFERSLFQRMIFDVDGQTLDRGVKARPFRHRPRLQRAVEFKAKVVMQTPCIMFLNYKGKCVPVRIAIAFTRAVPPLRRGVPDGSGLSSKRRLRRYVSSFCAMIGFPCCVRARRHAVRLERRSPPC